MCRSAESSCSAEVPLKTSAVRLSGKFTMDDWRPDKRQRMESRTRGCFARSGLCRHAWTTQPKPGESGAEGSPLSKPTTALLSVNFKNTTGWWVSRWCGPGPEKSQRCEYTSFRSFGPGRVVQCESIRKLARRPRVVDVSAGSQLVEHTCCAA